VFDEVPHPRVLPAYAFLRLPTDGIEVVNSRPRTISPRILAVYEACVQPVNTVLPEGDHIGSFAWSIVVENDFELIYDLLDGTMLDALNADFLALRLTTNVRAVPIKRDQ
jgi:hypothetical protein